MNAAKKASAVSAVALEQPLPSASSTVQDIEEDNDDEDWGEGGTIHMHACMLTLI